MIDRRKLLGSAAGLGAGLGLLGCARPTTDSAPAGPPAGFVVVRDGAFQIDGAPYRYSGANLWYGAYLGADAPFGNRDRLKRELDRLKTLGVANLRVLASSELSPLKNSVTPAFRDQSETYNETLFAGLDYLLAEMGARDMRAVLYLTNFWEWSGGMMTYLFWTNGGRFINMNDPAHPWPEFPDFNAAFYGSETAVGLYHHYVRAAVGRTNTITGASYANDKTIMAWQLANEPRPAGRAEIANMPAYHDWIDETAALIKSLDANHLVSTGSEGLKGCVEQSDCVIAAHDGANVDYLTAHIWPQNWGWADPRDLAGTFATVEANTKDYIARHIAMATQLQKPLVIEEFGFPRDEELYTPGSPTSFKDRFYKLIFDAALEDARKGGPLQGTNFWAWSGEGRAQHADHRFAVGDTAYVGDPPHEPQGWYSVFDGDASTIALVRAQAEALAAI